MQLPGQERKLQKEENRRMRGKKGKEEMPCKDNRGLWKTP